MPVGVVPGREREPADAIAEEIIAKYELRLLRRYIREIGPLPEVEDEIYVLAAELLTANDAELAEYREKRREMISASIAERIKGFKSVIPRGALNFLCDDYRAELAAIAAAAAELIAEERHGDICCLIAGEYIERRMRRMGSKLLAVHLVIGEDTMSLYDGRWAEITDEYSSYIPPEDRSRYSRSDLVLSALVDIAPRSIYVYGGENNLKMLRRVQLMFSGVMVQ